MTRLDHISVMFDGAVKSIESLGSVRMTEGHKRIDRGFNDPAIFEMVISGS
jgi:hypothetical protein